MLLLPPRRKLRQQWAGPVPERTAEAYVAWVEFLSLLEGDLDRGVVSPGWRQAAPSAPLPHELAPRAIELVRAQQEHVKALEKSRDDARAQADATARVPSTAGEPVYLDING